MGAPVPSTPTKDFPPQQQHQQQQQQQQQRQLQQQQYGHASESSSAGDTNNQRYNSSIEPLIKTRQFDKPAEGNSGADDDIDALFERAHEFAGTKPIRANLKEISLSDVLERSISQSKAEEAKQETDTGNEAGDSAIDHDLFSSVDDLDGNGANSGGKDDGVDDLYDDIDGTQAEPADNVTPKKNVDELAAAVMAAVSNSLAAASTPAKSSSNYQFVQNNNFGAYESEEGQEGDNGAAGEFQTPTKQKTPFQAVMPKVAKQLMAPPPNFMEDDERCPWPLMPVIDLSNDGSEQNSFDDGSGGFHQRFQHANSMEHTNGSPAGFLRQPGKNEFRPRFPGSGGDRRFPSPGQSRGGGDMRGRGRFSSPRGDFSSPRGDFRPRGGYQNQMRMPRTPGQFQPRGPGGANFQNSPRMFKGPRGNRPFRRGW